MDEEIEARYGESFGEILRKSFVVSLVIFLEQEIGDYCAEFKKHLNLDIGWNYFKGTLLERFKLFSNKLLKLKLNIKNDLWQDLQSIISLRNCLVHSGGWLTTSLDSNRIIEFSKRKGFLQIQEDGYIEISTETCEQCLQIIKEFIEIIYEHALIYFPGKYGK